MIGAERMRVTADAIQQLLFWIIISLFISYYFTDVLNFYTFRQFRWHAWFLLIVTPAIAVTLIKPQLEILIKGRAVLITGCDSGFGFCLAQRLYDLGFVVFAGCFEFGDGADYLSDIDPRRLHVFQLDVTSQNDINRVFQYVNANLPSKGLWGLVNNGGMATFGFTEWLSLDEYQKLLDVNLLGTIRVTKTFLPLIRQSEGRIVNMSSRLGILCTPAFGSYSISKYGIEAFTDTLRYEMRPFKVDVCLLEPGNYVLGTNIMNERKFLMQIDKMWNRNMSEENKYAYAVIFSNATRRMDEYITKGEVDLTPVIDAYTDALVQSFPRERYQPMTLYYKIEAFIALHLPEFIYEYLYIPKTNVDT